jgi:hypothetical protein
MSKWWEVRRTDGSNPRPREMPRYNGNTADEALKAAGLSCANGQVREITCPECCYELEYGEVGPYEIHTCEMEEDEI